MKEVLGEIKRNRSGILPIEREMPGNKLQEAGTQLVGTWKGDRTGKGKAEWGEKL